MSVKLLVLALVIVAGCAYASPADRSNYIEQENSCRQVCGLCDCDGFYCEDECICECNMEDDENLQCITDMKKECDANGLEYEVLMQESAKERFMRHVKEKSSPEFARHMMILKQKRGTDTAASADAASEPVVGAPAPPSDPTVGAPAPASAPTAPAAAEEVVGVPLPADPFTNLKVKKLLVDVKDGFSKLKNAITPTAAPITWPTIGTPQGKIIILPTPAPITFPSTTAASWLSALPNPGNWKAAIPDTSNWKAALPDTSSWKAALPDTSKWTLPDKIKSALPDSIKSALPAQPSWLQ